MDCQGPAIAPLPVIQGAKENSQRPSFHFNSVYLEQCLAKSLKKAEQEQGSEGHEACLPFQTIWNHTFTVPGPCPEAPTEISKHQTNWFSPSTSTTVDRHAIAGGNLRTPDYCAEIASEVGPIDSMACLLHTRAAYSQELSSAYGLIYKGRTWVLPCSIKYRGGPSHHESERVCVADSRWQLALNLPSVCSPLNPFGSVSGGTDIPTSIARTNREVREGREGMSGGGVKGNGSR